MKKDLMSKLEILYNTELSNGFPYEDIEQIEKDFEDIIKEESWLVADFNEFCMLIAGSSTYVLANKKIPKYQRQFLYKDFFSLYPKYSLLKESLGNYPDFHKELISFEKTRELLLDIIKNK
ncbi:YxiJ family protein [Bacillus haynesii]|uniref:YxiJ family protein n=1 Tax=Bacillus haynesii TaxID=1925021 RepID=UPI00228298A0|nr:YxiJ family protein [Bacillus haynesii]MCY8571313.1 YxiJ-like family protein [Bacillus haynesii]MCY8592166.1 YxiJ-like family protein [Bacillus haynesii]